MACAKRPQSVRGFRACMGQLRGGVLRFAGGVTHPFRCCRSPPRFKPAQQGTPTLSVASSGEVSIDCRCRALSKPVASPMLHPVPITSPFHTTASGKPDSIAAVQAGVASVHGCTFFRRAPRYLLSQQSPYALFSSLLFCDNSDQAPIAIAFSSFLLFTGMRSSLKIMANQRKRVRQRANETPDVAFD